MTLADRLREVAQERGYGSQVAVILREAAAELDRLTQERENMRERIAAFERAPSEHYIIACLTADREALRARVRSLEAELKSREP